MQQPPAPFGENPGFQPQGIPDYTAPHPVNPLREPRGKVSFDVISDAWLLLKPEIGQWILAVLTIFGINMGVSAIFSVIQIPFLPKAGQGFTVSYYVIQVIAQIVSLVVSTLVGAGVIKMAISHLRTRRPQINEIFTIFDLSGPLLLSSFFMGLFVLLAALPGIVLALYGLLPFLRNTPIFTPNAPPTAFPSSAFGAVLGGYALAILLPLPVYLLFLMTIPLIVDKKMGALSAMSLSAKTMRSNLAPGFGLLLVLGLINMAGVLVCCVGILVSYAISFLSIALVYRDLFGIGDMPLLQKAPVEPPPIANPGI